MMASKLKVSNAKSIEEVLESTGMNWDAESHPLVTGGGLDVPNFKAMVRSDNSHVLGVVGSKYQPVQNSLAFGFMDTLVQKHDAEYENVYSLKGGAYVIVQARIHHDFEARRGDRIASYITMLNSFDGTTSFKVYFTPIRLFCTNQLGASWRKKAQSITVRHSVNAKENAEEGFRVLCSAQEYFEQFQEKARVLAQKAVDQKMVDKFLKEVLGEAESTQKKNQHEKVTELFQHGKGNKGETMWDLYNGVTEYVDHHGTKDDDKRLASALMGHGLNLKDKAWNAALALTN